MLHLRLLGPLEIIQDEQLIRFPTHKVALLLCYLAANRRHAHPREVLAELFWPGSSAEKAKNSLRHAISTIRKLTASESEGECIVSTSGSLRFNTSIP